MTIAYDNAGWIDGGVTDYSPHTFLAAPMTMEADDLTVDVEVDASIGSVLIGSLCQIGNEYLRVDSMADNGSYIAVTFGRGCLDTVPEVHRAGDPVLFWQFNSRTNGQEYVATETVDIRLLGHAAGAVLDLNDAPEDTVTFDSRAIRPYPAGNLKVDGLYSSFDTIKTGTVSLTWAYRDRLQQVSPNITDFADGNIGPEAGTTYSIAAYAYLERTDIFATGSDFFDLLDVFADARCQASK